MATIGLEQGQFLRYVRTVGMTTMRGRGFYYPIDSTMSDGGRLYVLSRSFERATSDSMRVTMLNEDGEYFGVFGSAGWGTCQTRGSKRRHARPPAAIGRSAPNQGF